MAGALGAECCLGAECYALFQEPCKLYTRCSASPPTCPPLLRLPMPAALKTGGKDGQGWDGTAAYTGLSLFGGRAAQVGG